MLDKKLFQKIGALKLLLKNIPSNPLLKNKLNQYDFVSGVPRAIIYQFYPTKYDLSLHVALQHWHELIDKLKAVGLIVILDHPTQLDTLTILIEWVFSCIKHGYYTEHDISDEICQESYRIAISYLTSSKNNSFHISNVDFNSNE